MVATRPREAAAGAELLATVTTDSSADVIRLSPLTSAAVARLLEAKLDATPDPAVVETCMRVTRGTPFLVRELVQAVSGGGIGSAVQTVGRSVGLRLQRLPEHAGRLARALAVLEQSDLLQAARLAGLEEQEAAEAADLLAIAGILESGRPLRFVHPIVRDGIYSGLSRAERARGHRRAAELLAEQAEASAHVAEHLLACEPAADGWVVERLVEAACAAGKQGAPESEAVFLRRALAEPPPPGEQSALLLDLGMAEANAGPGEWAEHLQLAVDTAPNGAAAAEAAMVLGLALSRAHRFAEAVEVLDRAASSLDSGQSELALLLEAAAVIPGMNDPATAPSVALRRETLRERAGDDPAAPAELLAAAAFISVLTTSRPMSAPSLRAAHFGPDRVRLRVRRAGRGSRSQPGSRRRRSRCCGPSAMSRCGRCSTPRSRKRGRPETAAGLPSALRTAAGSRSDAAIYSPPRETRGRHWPRASSPRHPFTACSIPVCSSRRSSIRASSRRQRRRLRRSLPKRRSDRSPLQCFASPAAGCGSNSSGSPKGWMTSWRLASS